MEDGGVISSSTGATGRFTTNRPSPNCSTLPRSRNGNQRCQLPERERILIFDFGSQYGQLIARRVREQNVFCQVVRHDLPAARVAELNPRGLIFSGGPASVYAPGAPRCDPKLFDLNIPVLGICYGMQLACHLLGGEVKPAPSREFGRAVCRVHNADGLFADVPSETVVWMSHGDQVSTVNGDFTPLAETETCPVAAVRHRSPAGLRLAVPPGSQPHAGRRPYPA